MHFTCEVKFEIHYEIISLQFYNFKKSLEILKSFFKNNMIYLFIFWNKTITKSYVLKN
jgi:hypothetical protein